VPGKPAGLRVQALDSGGKVIGVSRSFATQ
jgi:hypothetical protein